MAPGSTPLDTWVSDNLLVLLGASDSTTVAFFQQLARSAPSHDALAATLTSNGLPDSSATRHFARDLFARVPRPTSRSRDALAADQRRKLEKEKSQLSGQRFSLVLDDDLASAAPSASSSSSARRAPADKGKARERDPHDRKRSTRKRDQGAANDDKWGSEDDEERDIKRRREHERAQREAASARRAGRSLSPEGGNVAAEDKAPEDEDEDPAARAERERLRDLAERDEFAARIRDKDKTRTKALVGERGGPIQTGRELDPQGGDEVAQMRELRGRARQAYLGKRELQQLDLLRLEVADFERDFRGVKLTKREQRELDHKKELLRLAEERLAIDDGGDHYQMPDGASFFAVFARASEG